MSETSLLLTCGLPGAGKTALATRLAAERRALRLTKDEWLWAPITHADRDRWAALLQAPDAEELDLFDASPHD